MRYFPRKIDNLSDMRCLATLTNKKRWDNGFKKKNNCFYKLKS
jgi:hypothetical protein